MTGSTKALFFCATSIDLGRVFAFFLSFFLLPRSFQSWGKNGVTSRALLIHVRCPSRASTSKPTDTYAPAHIGWMPKIIRNVNSLVRSDYPTDRLFFSPLCQHHRVECIIHREIQKFKKKSHHRKRCCTGELSVTC